MRLKEYLERVGITPNDFALSTGIAREIIVRVVAGKGLHAKTAEQIIKATHGVVTLADLTGSAEEAEQVGKSRGGGSAPARQAS